MDQDPYVLGAALDAQRVRDSASWARQTALAYDQGGETRESTNAAIQATVYGAWTAGTARAEPLYRIRDAENRGSLPFTNDVGQPQLRVDRGRDTHGPRILIQYHYDHYGQPYVPGVDTPDWQFRAVDTNANRDSRALTGYEQQAMALDGDKNNSAASLAKLGGVSAPDVATGMVSAATIAATQANPQAAAQANPQPAAQANPQDAAQANPQEDAPRAENQAELADDAQHRFWDEDNEVLNQAELADAPPRLMNEAPEFEDEYAPERLGNEEPEFEPARDIQVRRNAPERLGNEEPEFEPARDIQVRPGLRLPNGQMMYGEPEGPRIDEFADAPERLGNEEPEFEFENAPERLGNEEPEFEPARDIQVRPGLRLPNGQMMYGEPEGPRIDNGDSDDESEEDDEDDDEEEDEDEEGGSDDEEEDHQAVRRAEAEFLRTEGILRNRARNNEPLQLQELEQYDRALTELGRLGRLVNPGRRGFETMAQAMDKLRRLNGMIENLRAQQQEEEEEGDGGDEGDDDVVEMPNHPPDGDPPPAGDEGDDDVGDDDMAEIPNAPPPAHPLLDLEGVTRNTLRGHMSAQQLTELLSSWWARPPASLEHRAVQQLLTKQSVGQAEAGWVRLGPNGVVAPKRNKFREIQNIILFTLEDVPMDARMRHNAAYIQPGALTGRIAGFGRAEDERMRLQYHLHHLAPRKKKSRNIFTQIADSRIGQLAAGTAALWTAAPDTLKSSVAYGVEDAMSGMDNPVAKIARDGIRYMNPSRSAAKRDAAATTFAFTSGSSPGDVARALGHAHYSQRLTASDSDHDSGMKAYYDGLPPAIRLATRAAETAAEAAGNVAEGGANLALRGAQIFKSATVPKASEKPALGEAPPHKGMWDRAMDAWTAGRERVSRLTDRGLIEAPTTEPQERMPNTEVEVYTGSGRGKRSRESSGGDRLHGKRMRKDTMRKRPYGLL